MTGSLVAASDALPASSSSRMDTDLMRSAFATHGRCGRGRPVLADVGRDDLVQLVALVQGGTGLLQGVGRRLRRLGRSTFGGAGDGDQACDDGPQHGSQPEPQQ
jgi:hypothetical protein